MLIAGYYYNYNQSSTVRTALIILVKKLISEEINFHYYMKLLS